MRTPLQIEKIRNVILYIMQSFTDGVDYIKLFKILYFAQQDQLVKYGKVIVDDNFKAKKLGPVPSFTYKALKTAESNSSDTNFKEFLSGIEVHDQKVYTSVLPNMDCISGVEKRSLDATIEKYKDVESYKLSEMSHDSAWESAMRSMQDDPQKDFISIIDIARAGKATDEMVAYIREKLSVKEALS